MVEQSGKVRRQELRVEVLSQVQAELSEQRGKHSWGQAWGVNRQPELAAQREQQGLVRVA